MATLDRFAFVLRVIGAALGQVLFTVTVLLFVAAVAIQAGLL